jgi:hypothetical protein
MSAELIRQYNLEIEEICVRNALTSIVRSSKGNNLNFHEVTRKGQLKYDKIREFRMIHSDLLLISDEVMIILANMYLYRPFLNNPIAEAYVKRGTVYPNLVNLETKRYWMFSQILCEKLYNYWDRIGDLLIEYFRGSLKPREIYFSNVIDRIPIEYQEIEGYCWLKNFKKVHYPALNALRNNDVHNITSFTEDIFNYYNNNRNKEKITDLLKKRNEMVNFYKEHMIFTIDGYKSVLSLINGITETILADVNY